MSPVRGLLLLPLPPQRTTFSHICIALYPSIQSTISHIREVGGPNETSVLEITVPITRLREAGQTHLDLFRRTNPLLARIYRLISTICRELNIPPGALDARVLLVHDVSSLSDEEPCPPSVLDYAALAASNRPWTHVFAVESEPGEDTFRKFTAMARENGPRRDGLFAAVRRVPSGMQIYVPPSSASIPDTVDADYNADYDADPDCDPNYDPTVILKPEGEEFSLRTRDMVVVMSGDIKDQFRDKHVLTMALFAIGMLEVDETTEIKEEASTDGAGNSEYMAVAVSKVDLDDALERRISDFIAGTVGAVYGVRAETSEGAKASEQIELHTPFYTYRELKEEYEAGTMAGTLVVSDRYPRLATRWASECSTSIMLESIEPIENDYDN